MRTLLLDRPRSTSLQLLRYLFVGGFAAVIDTATLYALHHLLGVHHLVAAAAGFLVGLLANYLISIAWVFESSGSVRREFSLFALIGVGGLLWTELILWVAVDRLGTGVLPAKIVALALVLFWNFGMRKALVFRGGTREREAPLEAACRESA